MIVTYFGYRKFNLLIQCATIITMSILLFIASIIFSIDKITTSTLLQTPILFFIVSNTVVGVFTKEKYISYLIISFIIFCTILLSYYLIVNYIYQTFSVAPELKVMLLSICVFYLCTQFLANVYKAVLFLINRIDE